MDKNKLDRLREYVNIEAMTPIGSEDQDISFQIDFKRGHDLRSSNEFIIQMRQQFFQEIKNLQSKLQQREYSVIAEHLALQPKTDVNKIYSFNQLRSMNIRFASQLMPDELKEISQEYQVNEVELTSIQKMLDILLGSEGSHIQLSFEGFFLLLLNIHGTYHMRNLLANLEAFREQGVPFFTFFSNIHMFPEDGFQNRVNRLVTLFGDIFDRSNQQIVQTRYSWQYDLKMLLHRLIHERQYQIYEKHNGKKTIDKGALKFYDLIKYPELITSSFFTNIYTQQSNGMNIIMIFEMIFEVLEILVRQDFKINANLRLKDLPLSNSFFLVDPKNYI